MAVVKATFTKSRGGAKASIRYIAFRPGKNGEEMSRQLFGHDGALSLLQADRIVDEAKKGTNFFRLVLITRSSARRPIERLGYVGVCKANRTQT